MNEHSDADLVVLHTLRCVGAASTGRIAASVRRPTSLMAEDVLLDLAVRGLVTHDGGVFGGWRLTTAGRDADARWIADELERAGARDDVRAAYDDFLGLNQRTLEICSVWQVRSFDPLVLNDHTDRAYDGGVLRKLSAVDAQAQNLCAGLAGRLHRFSHYGSRLTSALERAERGELDQVTDSLDSYHTTWCQLHEDLLVTLGIDRDEPTR